MNRAARLVNQRGWRGGERRAHEPVAHTWWTAINRKPAKVLAGCDYLR